MPESAPRVRILLELFSAKDPENGRAAILIRATPSIPEASPDFPEAARLVAELRMKPMFRELWMDPAASILSGSRNPDSLLASIPGGLQEGQFAGSIDPTVFRFWAAQADETLFAVNRALEGPLSGPAADLALGFLYGANGCLVPLRDRIQALSPHRIDARFLLDGEPSESPIALADALSAPLQIIPLGSFRCDGDLLATDPCYGDMGMGCRLSGAEGEYRAWSVIRGMDDWGARCSELWVCAADAHPLSQFPGFPGWAMADDDVGVDSGQAGFFPAEAYASLGDPEREAFYSECGKATLSPPFGAGPLPFGAFSSSGDGDGGYPCMALRDESGRLLAARLEFYERDPEFSLALLSEKAKAERALISESSPSTAARRPKPL